MTIRTALVLALAAPAGGVLTAQTPKNYTPADVHFVAGMIGHHAQAIQMAKWAPSHGASPAVRVLCERIVVAQTDEIAFAQRWLREHGEYVPPADPRGHIRQGIRRRRQRHLRQRRPGNRTHASGFGPAGSTPPRPPGI